MASISIGTTAWSFDDWVGTVYPFMTDKSLYLRHYAERFPIVEIDSSFYGTPRDSAIKGWIANTPDTFRFTAKAPREITHERVLIDCEDVMEQFLDALKPMGEKLSAVLLQFGYFNRGQFPSAGPFLQRLDAFLERFAGQVPLACEIRNKTWLTGPYYDLLRRHRVAAALVEHEWLPPIDLLVDRYDVLTSNFVYVRLMGDREGIRQITTHWDKVVLDRSADLRRIAAVLKTLAERVPLHVFVSNHYAGHAPQTAADLAVFLNEAGCAT